MLWKETKGSRGELLIVYKLVKSEDDVRKVSLMSPGEDEVVYKPGEFAYPRHGVLYAFDSLERAQGYIYRCGVSTLVI